MIIISTNRQFIRSGQIVIFQLYTVFLFIALSLLSSSLSRFASSHATLYKKRFFTICLAEISFTGDECKTMTRKQKKYKMRERETILYILYHLFILLLILYYSSISHCLYSCLSNIYIYKLSTFNTLSMTLSLSFSLLSHCNSLSLHLARTLNWHCTSIDPPSQPHRLFESFHPFFFFSQSPSHYFLFLGSCECTMRGQSLYKNQ